MSDAIVIIPTYNEKENIKAIVEAVFPLSKDSKAAIYSISLSIRSANLFINLDLSYPVILDQGP